MELGELELAVLTTVRTLGEASPGQIYEELRKSRDVAYTSVTTTLYRLVDKGLIAFRKASEKRIRYRLREGRAYRQALASMVDQVVSAFGAPAVSYVLQGEGAPDQVQVSLQSEITKRRKKEQQNG